MISGNTDLNSYVTSTTVTVCIDRTALFDFGAVHFTYDTASHGLWLRYPIPPYANLGFW